MKKDKKVHIVWTDWETLLCEKELRPHDDYLTIGAYELLVLSVMSWPDLVNSREAICAHCLRKYNKLKENK